ncbi:rRNA processing protein Ipi1, putative [Talaromyces stipitatus ATCC 10500]|uniref:Pre-rRNA-processing protein n=1 Tax=Talaromyces stipitatus (strain ATCC 10500 / CBS 375.48 / QM 6759 / NRRL 1006) TaxID=441959 RepID=B8MKI9_TALSN|nr:rRNA processing protein Ipi1, putative [Talaromyces stipitatus ATCC 10500]EED15344.1 rRNA processing protein Ipi1, putative [Talaromyces stipitatus ATCC 10500]
MGSSQKRKKEKQKDFQAKAKPANFTDTSFRSKAIVLNQQSLSTSAPTSSAQFSHHLSLLSSKSDIQRKESLAHLTTSVSSRPVDSPLPQPVSVMIPKLVPLLLDASNSVRAQLLKFLKTLPTGDIEAHAAQLLPYIRAGMTHLAADIRSSAVEVLGWLVETAGGEVVSCPGGWIKTLNCFLSLLGWHTEESAKWSSNRSSFGKAGSEGRPMVKALHALAEFLRAGISSDDGEAIIGNEHLPADHDTGVEFFPVDLTVRQNMIPDRSAPYAYLNLFGQPRDAEGEMYESREDRLRVFGDMFRKAIERGVENARKEGGEVGRASAAVFKVLRETRSER